MFFKEINNKSLLSFIFQLKCIYLTASSNAHPKKNTKNNKKTQNRGPAEMGILKTVFQTVF